MGVAWPSFGGYLANEAGIFLPVEPDIQKIANTVLALAEEIRCLRQRVAALEKDVSYLNKIVIDPLALKSIRERKENLFGGNLFEENTSSVEHKEVKPPSQILEILKKLGEELHSKKREVKELEDRLKEAIVQACSGFDDDNEQDKDPTT